MTPQYSNRGGLDRSFHHFGRWIGALLTWPDTERVLWLLDWLLVSTTALLIFTPAKIFFFHLIFVFLTFGAFFWALQPFIRRAILWVTTTTLIIGICIWLREIQVEEIIEIPMLTLILILVSAIATRRARAEEKLIEANEQLENRVLERTRTLQQEIDERRKVENTLRQSEERYRHLMELSFETIMIAQNEKLVEINSAGTALLGAQHIDQLKHKSLYEFVHPSNRGKIQQRFKKMQDHQTDVPPLEDKFVRLDGSSVDVEVAAIPIKYQGEQAIQMVVRDITKRKETEMARTLERMRIARDLHDSLGQSVGFLHLKLDALVNSSTTLNIQTVQPDLAQMRDVANDAYEQIREVLATFLPSNVNNLSVMLYDLAVTIGHQSGFEIRFTNDGEERPIPAIIQQQLLYIGREALNNVGKHAAATIAKVALSWLDEQLMLTIQDDGCGFDVEDASGQDHFGLNIMQERATQIGAALAIASAPGSGTNITIQLPLRHD
ncbi:MAG: PAS domain S-box protein [Caldilineaceae bacterium]